MAITSTIEYCTDREVKDVFPNISGFDLKQRIYNWSQFGSSNVYEANNTGLVSSLFFDGRELNGATSLSTIASGTSTTTTALDDTPDADATNFNTVTLADASVFDVGDVMYLGVSNQEKALITGKSSNTLTIRRGFDGSTISSWSTSTGASKILELTEEYNWY